MIKGVLGKIPLFGICLGHQLVALACSADTERVKVRPSWLQSSCEKPRDQ